MAERELTLGQGFADFSVGVFPQQQIGPENPQNIIETGLVRPITVSLVGPDGSGKSVVTDLLAQDFGSDHRIARVAGPAYSIVEGERRDHYGKLIGALDKLGGLSLRAGISSGVLAHSRIIEPGIIREIGPDLVIGSRDQRVDPAVYSTFYAPILAKRPMDERLRFMQGITGQRQRDLIVLLDVAPEVAVQRLEARLEAQKAGIHSSGDRKKRDPHEDEHGIGRIRREYDSALNAVARRESGTQIIVVDTSRREIDEVTEEVKGAIERFFPTSLVA
jgi:thymidylate kinase